MDRFDDVREAWTGALAPVPAELIGPHVSAATAEFLTAAGLPTENPLTYTFYRDQRLLDPLVRDGHNYLQFGDDIGVVPFVIEAGQDEVRDLIPKRPSRFVNSSLADFMFCLGVFCGHLPKLRAPSLRTVRPAVRRLSAEFAERDPQALASSGNWWPLLFGQTLEGFI